MHQTLIISSAARGTTEHQDTTVVATPLDAIRCLEKTGGMSTVILVGSDASNDELAAVLREIYPAIRLGQED
jgi:hypothetical protein